MLRKDFTVSPYQLDQARVMGASGGASEANCSSSSWLGCISSILSVLPLGRRTKVLIVGSAGWPGVPLARFIPMAGSKWRNPSSMKYDNFGIENETFSRLSPCSSRDSGAFMTVCAIPMWAHKRHIASRICCQSLIFIIVFPLQKYEKNTTLKKEMYLPLPYHCLVNPLPTTIIVRVEGWFISSWLFGRKG